MGNALAKRDDDTTVVDGGFVFPTGKVYAKTDCDLRIVKRLIIERKLSPFYVGDSDESDTNVVECPICFLYMPPNMNATRCCFQAICTECFLQIKHPASGGAAVCPFCVQSEFGIVYSAPGTAPVLPAEGGPAGRRKSLPHTSPLVVTVDAVRPNCRRNPPPSSSEPGRRGQVSRSSSMATRSQRPAPRFTAAAAEEGRNTRSNSTASGARAQSGRAIVPNSYTPATGFMERFMAARDMTDELEHLMLMEAIRLSLADASASSPPQGDLTGQQHSSPLSSSPSSSSTSSDNGSNDSALWESSPTPAAAAAAAE